MVGVPRSGGCAFCVKRRVKCDEARPACANCDRYGAECPGYDRRFKFVAGKHVVRSRGRPVDVHGRDLDHDQLALPSLASASQPGPESHGMTARWRSQSYPMLVSPTPNRAQLIGNTIQSLLHNKKSAHEIMLFAPWFNAVPERLGNKIALDGAMAAFTIHLLGKAEESEHLVAESRSLYGQSLAALQKALNHPVEWKSSETLCATMLLALFELFAGTSDPGSRTADPGSWMKHTAGVSFLIQQRGPDTYKESWDRSMLMSFRTLLIMDCLFSAQECFLSKKKWQAIILEPVTNSSAIALPENSAWVFDLYFAHLARVPGILQRGLALRESTRCGLPVDMLQLMSLVQDTAKLRADYVSWFESFERVAPAPTEKPSCDSSTIFDTALHYDSVWHGSVFMSYWATMLILQEILNICQYPVDFVESNRQMANNIFRSIETVRPGYMGPYRIGYPVRIAYEFGDTPTQIWLKSVMAQTEQHYAATSPIGYPEPGTTLPASTKSIRPSW